MVINRRLRFFILIVFVSLFVLGGCASVGRFSDDNEEMVINSGVYPATKMDFSILGSATKDHWGSGMAKVLSPFAIIDIPFSLITDTIMLPYDWYQWSRNSEYIEFWNNVAANSDASLLMDEYMANYKLAGAYKILSHSRVVTNEKHLKIYFDVAATDNNLEQSKLIIARIIERAKDYPDLREHVCDTAIQNIDKTDFIYGIHLILDRSNYSSKCVTKLADAGAKCRDLLRSTNLPELYIRKCYQENRSEYETILVKNKSAPIDLHEEIYERTYQKITHEYGSLEKTPLNRRAKIDDLARSTTSINLINKMLELNNSRIDEAMLFNQAVPKTYKEIIRKRRK